MAAIHAEDFVLLAWAVGYVVATVLLAVGLGLVLGIRWREVLSAKEWMIAGKLVSIIVLLLMLLAFNNEHQMPAEAFIYGRF